jgi:hypothetical protein
MLHKYYYITTNSVFSVDVMHRVMVYININVKELNYQFKHSVKDDQITRQKLQISILLIS